MRKMMGKVSKSAPVGLFLLFLPSMCFAQEPVQTGGCYAADHRPVPCSSDSGGAGNSGAALPNQADLARQRQAASDFNKGRLAETNGDLTKAMWSYKSAVKNAPDNAGYRQRLVAVELRLYKAKQGTALQEAAGIADNGKVAVDHAAAGSGTKVAGRGFDNKVSPSTNPLPKVVVPVENEYTQLANKLNIRLNLNDPKNQPVLEAITKIQYSLKYNSRAAAGGWKPDRAGFDKAIVELNEQLKDRGVPEVTPQQVQYASYSLSVTEGKKPGTESQGQTPAGGASTAAGAR